MLYGELIDKARKAVVVEEENGAIYLEPDYRAILKSLDLTSINITDVRNIYDDDIYDALEHYVQMRKEQTNKGRILLNKILTMIEEEIDPELLDKQNDLVKNVINYVKETDEVTKIKEQLEEQQNNNKLKISTLNFSKKEEENEFPD